MPFKEKIINRLIRTAFNIFCRIDKKDLEKIPLQGPAILISNHVSTLEGPLFYVNLRPGKTIAMVKTELFEIFLPEQFSVPGRLFL